METPSQAGSAVLSHEVLRNRLFSQVRANVEVGLRLLIKSPQALDKIALDSLDPARAREQLQMLERCTGESVRDRRILEVGCGHGLSVALARLEFGAQSYGIEPGDAEFAGAWGVSREVLLLAGLPTDIIKPAVGEAIPFPDSFFDVVYSSNVLEHVQDPQRVIDESLRVLKPQGFLHIVVPNYGSWWEGHYGILWFPHLPLWLGRAYVRLLGRDPAFLDTLQFINYGWLRRLLAPHRDRIAVLSWGQEVWEERIQTLGFSEWAYLGTLKQMVRLVHRLGLARLVIGLGKRLHWETPIILTAQKTM